MEWRSDLTFPPEPLEKGGMLRVPDTPGMGYKLNDKLVELCLVDKTTA